MLTVMRYHTLTYVCSSCDGLPFLMLTPMRYPAIPYAHGYDTIPFLMVTAMSYHAIACAAHYAIPYLLSCLQLLRWHINRSAYSYCGSRPFLMLTLVLYHTVTLSHKYVNIGSQLSAHHRLWFVLGFAYSPTRLKGFGCWQTS